MHARPFLLSFTLLLALGCLTACGGGVGGLYDLDGDGSLDADDCAPDDAEIYPGATDDFGDGVDQDCDGSDGVDLDGDGWAANAPEGSRDCNDSEITTYPGAADSVDPQGVDSNCDGVDGVDADGDGWASISSGGQDCDDADPTLAENQDLDGDGVFLCAGDCNDLVPEISPIAEEVCDGLDNNCDGSLLAEEEIDGDGDGAPVCDDCDDSDPSVKGMDADEDGFTECENDCNDSSPAFNPSAYDLWENGVGNDLNCDGVDGVDLDGDGYAGDALDATHDCNDQDPSVYPQDADGDGHDLCDGIYSDCDDTDANIYPFATDEACDGVDSNCGTDDEETEAHETDMDGDGYLPCFPYTGVDPGLIGGGDCDDGDAGLYPADVDGDGATLCEGDCDDNDPNRSPFLVDGICDGLDADCDPTDVDESDADGDGVWACAGDCDDTDPNITGLDLDGDGYSDCEGDCDENDASIFPGQADFCDGIDSDCIPDAGELDLDGDGYVACQPLVGSSLLLLGGGDCDDNNPLSIPTDADGDGYSGCGGDCDETDPSIYPGALELSCDGIDSDCIADAAEVDNDGDGWVDCIGYTGSDPAISGGGDCDDTDPTLNLDNLDGDAYTTCGGDCDDTSNLIFPNNADGPCDGVDSDCVENLLEVDNDGDGYVECFPWLGTDPAISGGGDCDDGNAANVPGDADGDGFGECAGDCDDADPSIYPGAPDTSCDGVDHDCDGAASELDGDGDGFMPCMGDCDDGNATRYPGATELCNDVDDDCNGSVSGDELDNDGDGFNECQGNDCDDSSAANYPGASEVCDGVDNNCNGIPDDQVDGDGDGWTTCGLDGLQATGDEDCDDGDASLNLSDVDTDGYVTCPAYTGSDPNILGGDDCDDFDASRWPGNPAWETSYSVDTDCSGGPGNSLVWADASFLGESAGDSSGWSVASAGDVDADGLDDLLIGAYANDQGGSGAGKTYLLLGSTVSAGGTYDLGTAHASFVGESTGDQSGYSVASAGDVDGDGRADLLIAANSSSAGGSDSGKTYLMLGSTVATGGTFDLSTADASFAGEVGHDKSGSSVTSAGDVDGDGKDDLLIGAPYNDEAGFSAGKTYLMLGSTVVAGGTFDLSTADASFLGEAHEDLSGLSVASAGDVDGDGLDDLLIGAPDNDSGGSNAGKTYLFLGSTVAAGGAFDLSNADASFVGESTSDNSGYSVASAGDVDGDGLDDLLIGAPLSEAGLGGNTGKTYLWFGSTVAGGGSFDLSAADATFVAEAEGDHCGWSVASAGDVDGDGLDDLMIGAKLNDQGGGKAGKTYLFMGAAVAGGGSFELGDADASFVGEAPNDQSGRSMGSAGDVDGDGLDDLLIGALYNDQGGPDAGKTYLLLSPY